MANFHVDSSGNLWLGDTSTTFTTSAPFYVQSDGTVKATSGTIGGISINSSDIQANYSAGSTGFKIDTNGDAEFNEVTIRVKGNSSDPSPAGVSDDFIAIGDSFIYDFSGNLTLQGDVVRIKDGNGGSETSPSLTFSVGFDDPGFYTVQDNTNTQAKLYWSSGSNNIIHSESDYDTLYIDAANIAIGTDTGQPSEFIGKNSSGQLGWHSVSTGSHDHDSDYDDYGSWTLKRGGSTVGNVSSGFGASWNAGSGLSVSSISNPFTITYSADFGTNSSQIARGNHSHTGTGISQINSPSTGFFSGYTFNTNTGAFSVSTSNTNSSSTTVGNLFPNTTGSDLGHPFGNGEWDRLYIQNNPNVSSDERKKENIEDLSYGLDYINTLSPKSYTLISDENSKVHWGFIAQQLLETPPEPDLDIAFVDYQEEHDHYSVAYAELIAPLVKGIQELSTKVDDLTARIEALEG